MNSKQICNMDAFLAENGLCRKAIANDGSCLYRAVSEKVYYTQRYHASIRKNLVDHMRLHLEDYQSVIGEDLNARLQAMEEGKAQPGLIEMIILSTIYSLDFTVFHSPSQEPYNLTHNNFQREIRLCYVGGSQYDLVFSKAEQRSAAVCQSVLYEILYRDVFMLDSELDEAVLFLELQKELPRNNSLSECFLSNVISFFGIEKADVLQKLCVSSSPPLPYRIAKALHPAHYRNVELDIVQEEKREARLRRLGISSGLSPGDKCQVVLDDNEDHPYYAHIQSIDEDSGTLLVFVEELGEKKTVPSKNVSPIPLTVSKPGDSTYLPVANIDILRYLKKGRRRRHHRGFPVAVLSEHLTPDRGRTISTTSTNSNSSTARDNCSTDRSVNQSVPNDHNSQGNNTSGSPSSSRPVCSRSSIVWTPSKTSTPRGSINERSHVKHCNTRHQDAVTNLVSLVSSYDDHSVAAANCYSPVYGDTSVAYSIEPDIRTLDISSASYNQVCAGPVSGTLIGGGYQHTPSQHHVMSGGVRAGLPVPSNTPHHPHQSTGIPTARPPPPHVTQLLQQQQGGYWLPVYQPTSPGDDSSVSWTPATHEGFMRDYPHSDPNTLRFFFNLGVEYYRMNSSGQPAASCYPPGGGVMYTQPANNLAELGAPTAGTAVMVDASGNHHYTSVLYSPHDMAAAGMDPQGILPGAMCVGEGHSSSCSNTFVAPLSFPGVTRSSFHPPSSFPLSTSSSYSHATKYSAHNVGSNYSSQYSKSSKHTVSESTSSRLGKDKAKQIVSNLTELTPSVSSSVTSRTNTSISTPSISTNNTYILNKTLNVSTVVDAKDSTKICTKTETNTTHSSNDKNEDNASEDSCMDTSSDRDSGCLSDCTSASTTSKDENNVNGTTPFIGPSFPGPVANDSSLSSLNGETEQDQEQDFDNSSEGSVSKPRGKRRYYMYGNHKLVKPIKEIPLRFQILLAETSAAKARCEGQPIYMQHQQTVQPMYDVVYYQVPDAGTQSQQLSPQQQGQLDVNANCFIPGQPGILPDGTPAMGTSPYECYTLCYPTNSTVPTTNLHAFPTNPIQPTPLFVPPMQQAPPNNANSMHQTVNSTTNSQNGQTIIVYSSQASVPPSTLNLASSHNMHSMSMPPPPFPPPTSLPPPPAEPMSTNSTPVLSPASNQLVVSLPVNLNQQKSQPISSKSQVVLSIPPPNHPPPSTNPANVKYSTPITHIPAPPPNPCMVPPNQTYIQQPITLPPSSQPLHQQPMNTTQPTPMPAPQPINHNPYPGGPTSQYMYIYPSSPAGQPGTAPAQVMFMAYPTSTQGFQQPVLVSPSCPVPVQ